MNQSQDYLPFNYSRCCIDLNNFPIGDFLWHNLPDKGWPRPPQLEELISQPCDYPKLPINLIKLVAKNCLITMNENHPKLEALTVLALEDTFTPFDSSAIVRVLWNKHLEHFSYINLAGRKYDVLSMLGPNWRAINILVLFRLKSPRCYAHYTPVIMRASQIWLLLPIWLP